MVGGYDWLSMVLGMKVALTHADNFVFGIAGEHRSYIIPLLRI